MQAGVTRARRRGSPHCGRPCGVVATTESGGEQSAFGGVGGELQCLLVGLPGIVGAAEVAQKRRPAWKRWCDRAGRSGLDLGQGGGRPVGVTDDDGPAQADDRGGIDGEQQVSYSFSS